MYDLHDQFFFNDFFQFFQETITKRWNLVCGNLPYFSRIVQAVFFSGNLVGMLLIGPFSDWYGRKTAYLSFLTMWSIVTIIGYFSDNPFLWIITRFLAGVSTLAFRTATDVYRYISDLERYLNNFGCYGHRKF